MSNRDVRGRFITSGFIGSDNYNWGGGLIEVSCGWCGKKLMRHPYRITKNNLQFCNPKHKGCWQKNNLTNENHPRWRGGKIVDKSGYVLVRDKNHHRSTNGYVREHILVAEKKYGKKITIKSHIHHLNGIKNDNRPENLLLTTNSNHDKFSYIHGLQKRIIELESIINNDMIKT